MVLVGRPLFLLLNGAILGVSAMGSAMDMEYSMGALVDRVDRGARCIVEVLQGAGYRAVLAGGCVRDLLLGLEPNDWDIATDAPVSAVAGLFARTVSVGSEFGISVVVLEEGEYEVAQFRTDGAYVDGRRPVSVGVSDERGDALRRDFTFNGLFLDAVTGVVVDYVGGQADLARGVLRGIGDAAMRFEEDGLRPLRAVRFAARFGFAIDGATWAAMQAHAAGVGRISGERVREELTKILRGPNVERGLSLLHESGILAVVLPEVAACDGVDQPPEFHPEGCVWTHTKMLFRFLPEDPSVALAWATLLHDIGKPSTQTVTDRIRFNGHDRVGAELAEGVCRRLAFSAADRDRVKVLVNEHMVIKDIAKRRRSKQLRWVRSAHFGELVQLHRADCLSSSGKMDAFEHCEALVRAVEDNTLVARPARLLTGQDLIEAGFTPGPLFGAALRAVEDAQLEGRVSDRDGALSVARSVLA